MMPELKHLIITPSLRDAEIINQACRRAGLSTVYAWSPELGRDRLMGQEFYSVEGEAWLGPEDRGLVMSRIRATHPDGGDSLREAATKLLQSYSTTHLHPDHKKVWDDLRAALAAKDGG